jgi:hypothetical protein
MGSAARGNGKENREILTELRLINSRRCAPPLCDQELQRIVDSVTRYPMGRESYHPNTTSPEVAADIGSETGTIKINEVEQVVLKHYPVLLPSVKCALAVFGTMPLAGRTKPLCMIFETTSGYGKSAVIQMCFAIGGLGLEAYVYRCDNFTPKTFVTHAANISQEKLAEIDLLPRLKDKVLVTKELSPIFRGREDHLKDTFAILIPVLDGKGFTSNSGVQGKRGYENEIIFNWIGATTPLPSETHRLMYQLGTRLLFFEVPAVTPDIAELLDYAKRDDASTGEAECQLVTNRFLVKLFERNPVGSVAPESITIPDEQLIAITRWSLFVATGRREIHCEKMNGTWVPVSAAKCEGPYKIVNYLKELARGHALIHDRTQVIGEDVELVAHVAISSLPDHLRPIVRALRETGEIDSTKCERLCNVSRPTARRYLLEASIVGLGNLKKGDPADNSPDNLILAPDFGWMRLP